MPLGEYRADPPPQITGLQPDPRHPHAVRVHVAGGHYCTVAREVVEEERLVPGRIVDPALHQRLSHAADVEAAFRTVLRSLGLRAYARNDLGRRLVAKGHRREAVDEALSRAERVGVLDDAAFAGHFVRTRAARGRGPARLVRDLLSRGVARPLIDRAIAEQWPEGLGSEHLPEELAARRARQLDDLPRPVRRRRLLAFLARRGFAGYEVTAMVDRVVGGG